MLDTTFLIQTTNIPCFCVLGVNISGGKMEMDWDYFSPSYSDKFAFLASTCLNKKKLHAQGTAHLEISDLDLGTITQ